MAKSAAKSTAKKTKAKAGKAAVKQAKSAAKKKAVKKVAQKVTIPAAKPAAVPAPAKPSSSNKLSSPRKPSSGGRKIHIGIGGWTFEPWRGVFYPKGLPQSKELSFAGAHLTSIEVNGTYYGSQKPESFRKWASEVPDGFIFSVKGPRFATNRRVLAEAGDSIKRFFDSGVTELGDRLGPLLWQFAPTKKFDEADFGKFLELLPVKFDGWQLRHCVEVRNPSFETPEFLALLRRFNIAVVYAEHHKYPNIPDVTTDFVYARLQKGEDTIETAYPPKALDAWAGRLETWARGGAPDDLALIDKAHKLETKPRDVFAYIIHEGKIRAPAGAMELIKRVGS
jgi:uncharacterized protein YecE (DUF72 family)